MAIIIVKCSELLSNFLQNPHSTETSSTISFIGWHKNMIKKIVRLSASDVENIGSYIYSYIYTFIHIDCYFMQSHWAHQKYHNFSLNWLLQQKKPNGCSLVSTYKFINNWPANIKIAIGLEMMCYLKPNCLWPRNGSIPIHNAMNISMFNEQLQLKNNNKPWRIECKNKICLQKQNKRH